MINNFNTNFNKFNMYTQTYACIWNYLEASIHQFAIDEKF